MPLINIHTLGANTEMYWLFNDYAKARGEDKGDDAHNATASDCHYQLEWIRWAKEHCDHPEPLRFYTTSEKLSGDIMIKSPEYIKDKLEDIRQS